MCRQMNSLYLHFSVCKTMSQRLKCSCKVNYNHHHRRERIYEYNNVVAENHMFVCYITVVVMVIKNVDLRVNSSNYCTQNSKCLLH